MGRFFVLIVEDQREVARLVRTSLEEIIGDVLEVRDVPSAEEAMLELSLRPADLLIVDLGLPGLSGRELISRVHQVHPHTHFLVLTGWDEGSARRAVRGLPIDEMLFKPVNLEDLIAAVRDALGLEEGENGPDSETGSLSYEDSKARLAELLTEGRGQLGMDAVLLLDDEGRVVLHSAGSLPNLEELRRSLVYLHSTGLELARILHQPLPTHWVFFRDADYEYALAGAARYYMMLWIQAAEAEGSRLPKKTPYLETMLEQVREILARMGVLEPATTGLLAETAETSPADEIAPFLDEEDLRLTSPEVSPQVEEPVGDLLASLDILSPQAADIDPDAFWEEISETKGTDMLHIDADALSYEEARRLGLVPDATEREES